MIKLDLIVGARPNFIKIAPIIHAIKMKKDKSVSFRLIHTGQHYDHNMSNSFFKQLSIPKPDLNIGAGSGTQAEQTTKIMIGYENILKKKLADICLVVGDVNSTMAFAIVAKKMGLKVAHVEAGIRSFDLDMPEEINRMVTDSITDYFFTTSEYANENLKKIGVNSNNIFFVGNTMIDTLIKQKSNFSKPYFWNEFKLKSKEYLTLTLHRPSNVDDKANFFKILSIIVDNSNNYPIIFPVHPRTKKHIAKFKSEYKNFFTVLPLPYLEFNYLVKNSKAVITDSGGITEETTVLNVPCMTLRDNTERPETIYIGTNELIGTDIEKIKPSMERLFNGNWKSGRVPPKWDGNAAKRIIDSLIKIF